MSASWPFLAVGPCGVPVAVGVVRDFFVFGFGWKWRGGLEEGGEGV